jgi:integrase
MASVFITRRKTRAGKTRHVVRYRLGGRTYPIQHGGSFETMKEAKTRRDLVAGELAAGRNPAVLFEAMRTPAEPVKVETLAELGERYLVSRVDLDEKTEQIHRSVLNRVNVWGGTLDPRLFTFAESQELVGWLMRGDEEQGLRPLTPATIRKYFNVFAQVLDFAGLEPNPARDRRVKLPTIAQDEPEPPTGKQFLAILDNVGERWTLPLLVMEQCAMHVEETLSLAWGDVDTAELRFRLRRRNVKGGRSVRARSPQVPDFLMDAIAATCPLEDRTAERKVFAGLSDDAARSAMSRACKLAGLPHFTPKSLRHRRATIWHHGGVVAKVLAERLGHSKTATQDIYTHVIDPGEVAADELQARLRGR